MPQGTKNNISPLPYAFSVDKAWIQVFPSKLAASQAAANKAAAILRAGILEHGCVRVIVGTGSSQADLINALAHDEEVDWSRVEVFHMDEYVGLSEDHPASFRRWLRTHLTDLVHPKVTHYLNADTPDLAAEARRYGELLCSAPIDLCFLGFGENGHIAFNDPHVADFNDPLIIKRVDLDERCRRQQVGEGAFADIKAVPRDALSITCPVLLSAKYLVCCVPELRKAEAVQNALKGPLAESCPASIVRTHPHVFIFLDRDSASRLPQQEER
jgi:glucosamine-6-phosphate deaminase